MKLSVEMDGVLEQVYSRLAPVSQTARLDAQVLLAHVLGKPRSWILAHPEAPLDSSQFLELEQALQKLEAGHPLPYVLGRWEFFNLEFRISPDVLIPRPETELLVEQALIWLQARLPARNLLALDLGAGSGCIAVTLAARVPGLHVVASDLSLAALRLAGENAARHRVRERVHLLVCDLLPPVSRPFDLVCANLPYIPSQELPHLAVSRREPRLALDGGQDGVGLIRRLLAQAPGRVSPGGCLLLEVEASQGDAVSRLARAAFPGAEVRVLPDLAGYDRLVVVHLS